MLQTFWSVNIFFSLCLAFLDFCVLYIAGEKRNKSRLSNGILSERK